MTQTEHTGTVTMIKDNTVYVRITAFSACHNCDARHGCGLMECQNKTIEVTSPEAYSFKIGETVRLEMNNRLGMLAVFYAYILPLLLMLAVLIGMLTAGFSEINAGISAIIILIPYYFWLFLMQKKLKDRFRFRISKR